MSTKEKPVQEQQAIPEELRLFQPHLQAIFDLVENDFNSAMTKKELKADETVVTETDVKLEKLITNVIKNKFPNDAILAEESENNQQEGERLWIIDPLCGTGNFAVGIRCFSTNIALFERGKPIFGLVFDHPRLTYYWASQENEGIYIENVKITPEISSGHKNYIIVDSGYLTFNHSPQINNFANIYQNLMEAEYYIEGGGASLYFAYTAVGKYAGMVAADVKNWDVVASCYLAEKNGGVVTDFEGLPWTYQTKNVVMSLSPTIHKNLLTIVQKHWR